MKTYENIVIPKGLGIETDVQTAYENGYADGYDDGYEAAEAKSVNLTQEEYDNLEEKECSVYYNIVEE